jgi:hypothetical protein
MAGERTGGRPGLLPRWHWGSSQISSNHSRSGVMFSRFHAVYFRGKVRVVWTLPLGTLVHPESRRYWGAAPLLPGAQSNDGWGLLHVQQLIHIKGKDWSNNIWRDQPHESISLRAVCWVSRYLEQVSIIWRLEKVLTK